MSGSSERPDLAHSSLVRDETASRRVFAWYRERELAPTVDEVPTALGRVGRVPAVGLLIGLHVAGLLTAEAAAGSVRPVVVV